MDNNLLNNSLDRYFKRLSQVGYVKYSDVNSLLVLLYIQEIIGNYSLDIDSLTVIDKALACLLGSSCLIPYPNCKGACV